MSKPENESGGVPAGLEGYETVGPSEIAKLLGRTVKSIQVDATRRPDTLPPRFKVPGTTRIRFLKKDVIEWMDKLSQVERLKREEESRLQEATPPSFSAFLAARYKRSRRL